MAAASATLRGAVVALALLCVASTALAGSDANMRKLKKLSQFTYGHLVIDGAVTHYEVFRATFGGPLPCGTKELVFADPANACGELDMQRVAGRFLVAERGNCTFVDKAHHAFRAGASGIIIVNHEGGMLRMPMGNQDGGNISIPVVMSNNATGRVIREALASGVQLHASMHPKAEPCVPEALMESWLGLDRPFLEHELREAARSMHGSTGEGKLASACIVGAAGTDTGGWVEGFPAEFGGPVTARTLAAAEVADPPLACTDLHNDLSGKVAVVYRGTCSMIEKARRAQAAGAVALLIVNSDNTAVRAMPDDRPQDIYIPVVMIGADSWELLSSLPEDTEYAIAPSGAAGSAWDDLSGVTSLTAEDWPADVIHRRRWLEELIIANHPEAPEGHWQRYNVVKEVVERAGFAEELQQAYAAVKATLMDGPAEESTEVVFDDVNTDVLAPLMLAQVTHRVLDEDGVNTEVAGANILCTKFRDSFHFKVPPLTRGSKNIVTQHLENLLKQQMCLEKVLTLNAIAVGQTIEYLRELQGDAAFEATAERLLRQVKAPAAMEALGVYEALGRFGYTRYEVGAEVTVGEWLSQHKELDESAPAVDTGGDDGSGDGSDDTEATVSADGEWSV